MGHVPGHATKLGDTVRIDQDHATVTMDAAVAIVLSVDGGVLRGVGAQRLQDQPARRDPEVLQFVSREVGLAGNGLEFPGVPEAVVLVREKPVGQVTDDGHFRDEMFASRLQTSLRSMDGPHGVFHSHPLVPREPVVPWVASERRQDQGALPS